MNINFELSNIFIANSVSKATLIYEDDDKVIYRCPVALHFHTISNDEKDCRVDTDNDIFVKISLDKYDYRCDRIMVESKLSIDEFNVNSTGAFGLFFNCNEQVDTVLSKRESDMFITTLRAKTGMF